MTDETSTTVDPLIPTGPAQPLYQRPACRSSWSRQRNAGQIDGAVDPEVLVGQLWGACYHRLLPPDQPLTEQFVVALVRNLLHGVRPAAGR